MPLFVENGEMITWTKNGFVEGYACAVSALRMKYNFHKLKIAMSTWRLCQEFEVQPSNQLLHSSYEFILSTLFSFILQFNSKW